MAEAVGEVGGGDGAHGGDDEDGDAPDLGGGGCIAQFADYGGDEEGAGVACVYYSHVHYDAGVDFPVGEDAFGLFLDQQKHYRIGGEQDWKSKRGGWKGKRTGCFV